MVADASRIVANTMSLAIAPVFLISAVAVLLSCMSIRYGRVIDRTRHLLREGDRLYGRFRSTDHVRKEIQSLYRRARIMRTAIILCVLSIFFVVIAIFILFIDLLFQLGLRWGPEVSFLFSLVVLLAGMVLFIEDFALSLESIKHDINTRAEDVNLDAPPSP